MRTSANRKQASIKFGPLIVIAAVGVGIYYWKFAPIERQLIAEIVRFEVTREPDEARTPPIRESLAATIRFANRGEVAESISSARFLVSIKEDLSIPRSWSTTTHRDSVLLDVKIPAGKSITHTFVIPWTGREETLYFPDDSKVYLGISISPKTLADKPITVAERFGYVVQRDGLIANSNYQPIILEVPSE